MDGVYCPSYIEMCRKLPLKYGHLSNLGTWDYPDCPKGIPEYRGLAVWCFLKYVDSCEGVPLL